MATSKGVLRNLSYSQFEILDNINKLHLDEKGYDADFTYSKGGFYGTHSFVDSYGEKQTVIIEEPKIKLDVYPQTEDTIKIEPLEVFPIEDESLNSCIIDPPFVCSCGSSLKNPKKGSNMISNRFSSYYPIYTLFESYSHLLSEAYRTLKDGGVCVFKCQNTISGSKFYCSEEFTWMEAQKQGFYVLDKAILGANNRIISGKVKKQAHFRNYASVFWVFKKDKRQKPIDYYSKWVKF